MADPTRTSREKLAWKFHMHRVEHVRGCHEFPNGGAGPRCTGPAPQDYKAADEVLYG